MESRAAIDWWSFSAAETLATPCLVIYRDRVQANIDRLVHMAGTPERLCPHLKTAKMSQIVAMYLAAGIHQFKCATVTEAQMAARAGAQRIVLAYPLWGAQQHRWIDLIRKYPQTEFATLVDSSLGAQQLNDVAKAAQVTLELLVDLDVGMHRTGIAPGTAAADLYCQLASLPHLRPGGFHIYDGHIHDTDLAVRAQRVQEAMQPVWELRQDVISRGVPVPRMIAGGSASFPIHLRDERLTCSPGTGVFWDFGYQRLLPEQPFEPAAVLLMRVVSRPTPDIACLDLGYKAVAAESPLPRIEFLGGNSAEQLGQSEEHLVVRSSEPGAFPLGTLAYAIPRHICPTVALYDSVHVVDNGELVEQWSVAARSRE